MAWEFGYQISLLVKSRNISFSDLADRLRPLQSKESNETVSNRSISVWDCNFSSVKMTSSGQDEFCNDLLIASEKIAGVQKQLLQIKSDGEVYLLIRIFSDGHVVFELQRDVFASFASLDLPVYFEYYNYNLNHA